MLKTIYPYIVIKPIVTEPKTKSGIIIGKCDGQSQLLRSGLSNESIYSYLAEVIYCPEGIKEVKSGDTVVFHRFNCRSVSDGLVVIDERDIIAKLEDA